MNGSTTDQSNYRSGYTTFPSVTSWKNWIKDIIKDKDEEVECGRGKGFCVNTCCAKCPIMRDVIKNLIEQKAITQTCPTITDGTGGCETYNPEYKCECAPEFVTGYDMLKKDAIDPIVGKVKKDKVSRLKLEDGPMILPESLFDDLYEKIDRDREFNFICGDKLDDGTDRVIVLQRIKGDVCYHYLLSVRKTKSVQDHNRTISESSRSDVTYYMVASHSNRIVLFKNSSDIGTIIFEKEE